MARLTQKTSAVLRLAAEEATKLGHSVWGSEHIVLALTAGEAAEGPSAAQVLERLGVTEARVRELILRHGLSRMDAEIGGVEHVLAGNETAYIVSNARWIAAYLRERLVDPNHLLLGTLWHEKPESKVLRELDASFEDAYRLVTGDDAPPEIRPERSVYVSKHQLQPLVAALPEVLPAGVSFGFAQDDETAWLSASPAVDPEDREVDLAAHIARALERAS